LTNVLDFLNQEVVIILGSGLSYQEGIADMAEDEYLYYDSDDFELEDKVFDKFDTMYVNDGYHLGALDGYITIVPHNRRCIFSNRDIDNGCIGGSVIGTIFWVKNYNELLEKLGDRNLKMISKAIIHPHKHRIDWQNQNIEYLDLDFLFSMETYRPEVIFKYNIDSYMSNVCLDVYNKLKNVNLNFLVDKYIPEHNTCDNYNDCNTGDIHSYHTADFYDCGKLRLFCYSNRDK
jgi:hypothetical protein